VSRALPPILPVDALANCITYAAPVFDADIRSSERFTVAGTISQSFSDTHSVTVV
jgi:hypothetical protein